MKNKKNKIVSILLATSMMSSTLVSAVFATDGVSVAPVGSKVADKVDIKPDLDKKELEKVADEISIAQDTPIPERTAKQQFLAQFGNSWLARQGKVGLALASGMMLGSKFVGGIKDISRTGSFLRYDLPYYIQDVSNFFKKKEQNPLAGGKITTKNIIGLLDEEFKKVKGQERAKQQLKDAIVSVLDKREQAEFGNKVNKGATLIMLKGASGTGKSMLLKCLENVLMGGEGKAYCIDSSTVDTSDPKSALDQLFSPVDMSYYYSPYGGGSNNTKQKPGLVKYLETNPTALLKVEEYDKWGNKSTDEMFRTMNDLGEVHSRGQKIDVSNLIVVMTSNEGPQDSTGSRTSVVRDKSLMNRFINIEFDNLCEEDYKEIAQSQLDTLKSFYEQKKNVSVNYINVAENIAKYAAKANVGARIIEQEIISSLRTNLIKEIMKSSSEVQVNKDKKDIANPIKNKLYVAYDHIDNKFFVSKNEEEVNKFSEEVSKKTQEKVDEKVKENK